MEPTRFSTDREADRTIPEFFLSPERNNFLSAEKGRDIFEDKEMVRVITPGNMKSIPVLPVTEEHKRRWSAQYAAFKSGHEQPVTGTPLDQVAFLTPAAVKHLQAMNVKTVEDLAGVSDAVLQNLPLGGREYRTKAAAFLDSAKGNALVEHEKAGRIAAEQERDMLKSQMQDLATRLAAVEEKASAAIGSGAGGARGTGGGGRARLGEGLKAT